MPTGGGGGGVTPSSNPQINSLGVGVAADGTTGDIQLPSGGTLKTSAGTLFISPSNSYTSFGGGFILNASRIITGPSDPGIGGSIFLVPQAFASLPAAAAGNFGTLAVVNNSTVNTFGATIAGGGANKVLAFSDGTNWTVAGI